MCADCIVSTTCVIYRVSRIRITKLRGLDLRVKRKRKMLHKVRQRTLRISLRETLF